MRLLTLQSLRASDALDVVNLKRKCVCLVDNHSNLVVSQILWINHCTTRVAWHSNCWFFNNTNRIAKVFNFASVIGISYIFYNRSTTEELENFLAKNFRGKIPGGRLPWPAAVPNAIGSFLFFYEVSYWDRSDLHYVQSLIRFPAFQTPTAWGNGFQKLSKSCHLLF